MITEKELLSAIAECEAEPITAAKVGKLADFYIIYDHLFGEPIEQGYSYQGKVENLIETNCDTDFLTAINGKDADKIWRIVDEAIEVLQTLHPHVYDTLLDKINDI